MSNIINDLLVCTRDDLIDIYIPVEYRNIKDHVDGVVYLLFVLCNFSEEEFMIRIEELFNVINKPTIVKKFGLSSIDDNELIPSIIVGVMDLKKFLENKILSNEQKNELLGNTFSGQKTVLRHMTMFSDLLRKLDKIEKIEIILEEKQKNIKLLLHIYKDLIYNKDFLTDPIIIQDKLLREAIEYKTITHNNDKIAKLFFYEFLLSQDINYSECIKKELKKYYIDDIDLICNLLEEIFKNNNLYKLIELNKIIVLELKSTKEINCEKILNEFDDKGLYGNYDGKCCYDINGEKCDSFFILDTGECKCNEDDRRGGNNHVNDYKFKYLKYKSKYLNLKKLNGIL